MRVILSRSGRRRGRSRVSRHRQPLASCASTFARRHERLEPCVLSRTCLLRPELRVVPSCVLRPDRGPLSRELAAYAIALSPSIARLSSCSLESCRRHLAPCRHTSPILPLPPLLRLDRAPRRGLPHARIFRLDSCSASRALRLEARVLGLELRASSRSCLDSWAFSLES